MLQNKSRKKGSSFRESTAHIYDIPWLLLLFKLTLKIYGIKEIKEQNTNKQTNQKKIVTLEPGSRSHPV